MELTQAENLAFYLLRNAPEEMQKIARPDGSIPIDALHAYYTTLVRKLDLARTRRRQEYIDIEGKIHENTEV